MEHNEHDVHVFIHIVPPDGTTSNNNQPILDALKAIQGDISKMASALDQLVLDVAAENTVIESAITLLNGLSALIKAAGTDPTKLAALSSTVNAESAKLAAALLANALPASTPPPGAPAITGISALSGAPGSALIITGTNFGATQGTSTIAFNGVDAGQATAYSDTAITINVPALATTGDVLVKTAAGTTAAGFSFFTVTGGTGGTGTGAPAVTSLTPTSGAAGSSVVIAGSNFGAVQGASTVTFNGTSAGLATAFSATSITVNVPAGATTGNLLVNTANGSSAPGQLFTVSGTTVGGGAPAISGGLTPTSGAVGSSVVITGTGFGATQGTSTISFNGMDAGQASAYSDTSITVAVPAGAGTGDVLIKTANGTSQAGVTFTVLPLTPAQAAARAAGRA